MVIFKLLVINLVMNNLMIEGNKFMLLKRENICFKYVGLNWVCSNEVKGLEKNGIIIFCVIVNVVKSIKLLVGSIL